MQNHPYIMFKNSSKKGNFTSMDIQTYMYIKKLRTCHYDQWWWRWLVGWDVQHSIHTAGYSFFILSCHVESNTNHFRFSKLVYAYVYTTSCYFTMNWPDPMTIIQCELMFGQKDPFCVFFLIIFSICFEFITENSGNL